jgi:hypothetical protein
MTRSWVYCIDLSKVFLSFLKLIFFSVCHSTFFFLVIELRIFFIFLFTNLFCSDSIFSSWWNKIFETFLRIFGWYLLIILARVYYYYYSLTFFLLLSLVFYYIIKLTKIIELIQINYLGPRFFLLFWVGVCFYGGTVFLKKTDFFTSNYFFIFFPSN